MSRTRRMRGGGCGCGETMVVMRGGARGSTRRSQRGGQCPCSLGRQGGGYRATKRNLNYLRRWKRGESIGFTMTASLKAKGLIPRTSKAHRGKKVLGPKYK